MGAQGGRGRQGKKDKRTEASGDKKRGGVDMRFFLGGGDGFGLICECLWRQCWRRGDCAHLLCVFSYVLTVYIHMIRHINLPSCAHTAFLGVSGSRSISQCFCVCHVKSFCLTTRHVSRH